MACHANAAEALLRLDRPFEARVSALGALALDAGHAKARYRLGVALLALRRYGAAEALAPLLGAGGAQLDAATHESIEAAVARARRRAADARGDFWASYVGTEGDGEEGRARHFLGRLEEGDVGTYFHPALEIRSAGVEARPEGMALMGRGLFVRAAVAQGTVLLVEEATAHVAETDEFERFGMQLDISSMTMDVGDNDMLGREVLQRMRSPVVNARVLALFDGWEEQGGHGRVVCERIPPLDLFATDAPEDASVYEEGSATLATEEPADVARIQGVIRFNHFNSGRDPHVKEYKEGARQGMGLWGLASMMNHAAERPTATQQYTHGGRVMVLRAARDLAAGEQVTLDYGPGPEEASKGERGKGGGSSAGGGGGGGGGGSGKGKGGGGRRGKPTREELLRQKGVAK